MGVSIQQWRCAIGTFHCTPGSFPNSSGPVGKVKCWDQTLLSTSLKLSVLLSLLAIGCVELNPGPKSELQCRDCSFCCTSAAEYTNHLQIHSLSRKFLFRCPLCVFKTSNKRNLEVHLCRSHVRGKSPSNDDEPLYLADTSSAHCNYQACEFTASTTKQLFQHLCSHIKNGEEISCPFGTCVAEKKPKTWVTSFSKVQNFSSHFSKYHKNSPLPVPLGTVTLPVDDSPILPGPSHEMHIDEPMETHPYSEGSVSGNLETEAMTTDDVCDFIAKFYLKLEADLLLPSSTVQVIAEHLSTVVNFSHTIVKRTMVNELAKLNISNEDAERVAYVSLSDDPLFRVHNKNYDRVCLTSEHLRRKYYREQFSFKEPVKKPLRSVFSSTETGKEKAIQCVPIRESLTQQLQDPQVQEDVDVSFTRVSSGEVDKDPSIYSDFTDGEVFRNHPASKEKSLYLLFFWDSFGVTHPLGSAKNSHKTVGVYYVLGNLAPERRSRVDVLQLCSLFFESHFKNESLEVCMEPIVEELKDLQENGIMYKGVKIPVYILFVLADNLGAHQIGGFVQSFSGSYWCRYCCISKNEFQEKPYLELPFRSPEDYESFAQMAAQEGSKVYKGIKFSSILNSLKWYHVCLPGLPPCLAHDLFEGCFAHDMMLIISDLIKKKWFTRDQLNDALKKFKFFGIDAADKPSTIELGPNKKLKAKLSGSAVKNWTMIRFFSLIVHDMVKDVNDPVWQLYLSMKHICEIVCAPQIASEDIIRLSSLIEGYLSERKSLFPENGLKPKHHFLRHYPSLIRKFGPLIRLFTLRMESNHYLLKRCARACNNFRDVPYTMAFKSQLRKAYLSTSSLFGDDFTYPVTRGFDPLWEENVRTFINELVLPNDSVCVNSVTINGTQYKCGMWLLIGRDESIMIVGKIIAIFCHTSIVFVVEKHPSTLQANSYGLHEIDLTQSLGLCHLSSLRKIESYLPLHAYMASQKYVLTLKHSPLANEIVGL